VTFVLIALIIVLGLGGPALAIAVIRSQASGRDDR
jgi:hypothetical protein